MSLLRVQHLGKRYGAVVALDDVSLAVAAGTRTAVVGPSGSGKTTLLRLIAGFDAPDSGTIELDDQVLANADAGVPPHRRNIGLMMQEGALFPHLSVLDNIRFGIRHEADAEARAYRLMDMVELERSMASRQPHQLSGGQQQRVAFARSLARRPRVMLLDEPFTALDMGLREQLRQMTAQLLSEERIATVLVTHDREEAMVFADQLVVLRHGRLVQEGAPRQLYLAPADAETAAFLGPTIVLDAEIRDGIARCVLGLVPVACPARAEGIATRIMLRPEQLTLSTPTTTGDAPWRLSKVEFKGASARLAMERADPPASLSFEAPAANLPAEGSMVSISVSGTAHVLPVFSGRYLATVDDDLSTEVRKSISKRPESNGL